MKNILVLIVFLSSLGFAQKVDKASDTFKRVANGLIEFKSPESMINPEKFDSPVRKTIEQRMLDYKVPGVSLAIIDGNELVCTAAYGVLKAGTDKKVDSQSVFQAASTSKLITAAIVMHYVETGMLDLDTDVNQYLKSWKVPENEFTKTKKVTLRNLLTHQSGLPSTNFPYDRLGTSISLVDVVSGRSPAQNKPAIPVAEPGNWQYSNIGYVLIQLVLEDRVDKPFAEIAEEVVFSPLKMTSTTFVYPLKKGWQDREAMPHGEDGIYAEPEMHPVAQAQGGLVTTPADLARFAIEIISAYQGKSGKIIDQKHTRLLLCKEIDLDPQMFGMPIAEGLGVMLLQKGDHTIFLHPGSNQPGTNCWLIASAQTGKGAVVMTNGAMGEVLAMEIITAISREFTW
jgi:CubicO group peptidase (beta-lactamase class C family)